MIWLQNTPTSNLQAVIWCPYDMHIKKMYRSKYTIYMRVFEEEMNHMM